MPTVKQGESRDDFISRCVPIVMREGTAKDNKQAIAICGSMFDKKDMKLETANINNVEIFELGTWKGHEFKKEDAEELIKNFESRVADPYISLDHDKGLTEAVKKFLNVLSLGNISKLWLEGKKLMANFKKVPKLIAELIDAGSLGKRSVEWWLKFRHASGKFYNNVLESVTYHGANGLPALSTLNDIPKIFKDESIEGELVSIELKSEDGENLKKEFQMDEKLLKTIEENGELKAKLVTVETEKKAIDTEMVALKSQLEKTTEELTALKTEKDDLVKMKADFDKEKEDALTDEATKYVDGIIEAKKLLPKYKDMKVAEYIRLKNDEDGLKLFKEELEEKDEVMSEEEITKKQEGESKDATKPSYDTEKEVAENAEKDMDKADEAIEAKMKKEGYIGADGYARASYELGLISKTELPDNVKNIIDGGKA